MSSVSHPFPPPRKDKWRGGGTVGRNVYRADVCLEHAAPLMMNSGCAGGAPCPAVLGWKAAETASKTRRLTNEEHSFQPPFGARAAWAPWWITWADGVNMGISQVIRDRHSPPQSKHSELKVQPRLCRHLLLPIHQQTSLIPSTHTYTHKYFQMIYSFIE